MTDELVNFYKDTLGFGVSDFYHQPFTASSSHQPASPQLSALIQSDKDAVHHMMLEMYSLDDVGQGYDLAQLEEGRLAVTPRPPRRRLHDLVLLPGRHRASCGGIRLGWPGDRPGDLGGEARQGRPSLWGHDRSWLPPDIRAKARQTTLAAEDGYRRPVQVIEGNYNLMPGVCPRWDGMKKAGAA